MRAGAARNCKSREYQITAGWKPAFQLIESQLYAPAQEPFVFYHCHYKPRTSHQSSAGGEVPSMARCLALPHRCHLPLGRLLRLQLRAEGHLGSAGSRVTSSAHQCKKFRGEIPRGLKRVWLGHVFSLVELAFSFRIFISRKQRSAETGTKEGFSSCLSLQFPVPRTFLVP